MAAASASKIDESENENGEENVKIVAKREIGEKW